MNLNQEKTLRQLFELVATGQEVSEREKSAVYSHVANMMNYAGIECNLLNIQRIEHKGETFAVSIVRTVHVEQELIGSALISSGPARRHSEHTLPTLLMSTPDAERYAKYWRYKLKAETAKRATELAQLEVRTKLFAEFEIQESRRKAMGQSPTVAERQIYERLDLL